MQTTELTETSEELLDALSSTIGLAMGRNVQTDALHTDALHTGGGVMVAAVDLEISGRFMGRQLWLTRHSEKEWVLGFYDFAEDEADEGITVFIRGFNRVSSDGPNTADDPLWVAAQVAGIISRLGIRTFQGE